MSKKKSCTFPKIFLDRVKEIIPKQEQEEYLKCITLPLNKTIRKTFFAKNLKDFELTSIKDIPEAFFITRSNQNEEPLGKTLEHINGEIYVQSLSSMLPVIILDPQPHTKVLDLCAAPGSKSTFINQRMENTGVLVSNENNKKRSLKLIENLERTGSLNHVLTSHDGVKINHFFSQTFDSILLDAPCSGEAMGRKKPKFFTQYWKLAQVYEYAKLQKKLIVSAFEVLKENGVLVYCTCTSAPEENEMVVQHLLEKFPDSLQFEPINFSHIPSKKGLEKWDNKIIDSRITKNALRLYPHLRNENWDSESFFVIKIKKTKRLKEHKIKTIPLKKENIKVFKKNQNAEIIKRIAKRFNIEKDWTNLFFPRKEKVCFFTLNNEVYITNSQVISFIKTYPQKDLGFKILDKYDRLTKAFSIRIAPQAQKNVLDLDEKQKENWMKGLNISLEEKLENIDSENQVLVRYQNFGLGHGKIMGKILKNQIDRNLI